MLASFAIFCVFRVENENLTGTPAKQYFTSFTKTKQQVTVMSQIESDQLAEMFVSPPQKEQLPHSGCGCFSFVFAFLAIVMICGAFSIVFFEATLERFIPRNWGQENDPDPLLSTLDLAAGLGVFGSLPMAGLAFILAICGLYHPRSRKVFAIWGLCLSILPFIIFAYIILGARAGW